MTDEQIMEAEEELHPCPLCGEYDELSINGEDGKLFVNCPCGLMMGPRDGIVTLLHQWNRRVIIHCMHDDEPANGHN